MGYREKAVFDPSKPHEPVNGAADLPPTPLHLYPLEFRDSRQWDPKKPFSTNRKKNTHFQRMAIP